ncbi:MAG: hypothetical protein JXB45_04460 [Candidatus Krumholzibacteriota bacterium]|nr:hypothetical protein [Candidatus Krumholzibacteriota bacterium]
MKMIIIDKEIFQLFPGFKRGIIAVSDIVNGPGNERIKKLLQEEIEKRCGTNCVEHEFVKSWEEAHRKFGSNPNKYPPSIKSLLKRIQKGGGFPLINSVVALFNYISIKYLVPCGGDDVNRINGNLRLGFARGNETFIPLGSEAAENPEPGEVIYFDEETGNVMCRRWNWRNGDFTKITRDTKKIIINIDGVGSIPPASVLKARDELARLLAELCGATLKTGYIDADNQEMQINLQPAVEDQC